MRLIRLIVFSILLGIAIAYAGEVGLSFAERVGRANPTAPGAPATGETPADKTE